MSELLIVAGMHRSGTSLIAGLLQQLGWDVGPAADLMKPKQDNPRGFFEHLPAVRVNDRVLYRMGGSWRSPPALPPGWELDSRLDDLRDEAGAVIRRLRAASAARTLIKDPRFSLTLPLWETTTDVDKVLHVIRAPAAVVASLVRRHDDLDVGTAARLWTHYLLVMLRRRPAAQLVRPEDILEAPDREIGRLVDAVGGSVDTAALERSRDVLEEDLWGRSKRQLDVSLSSPELEHARLLHAAVTDSSGPDWRSALAGLAPLEELSDLDQQTRAALVREASRYDDLQTRATSTREQRDRALQQMEQLRTRLEDARAAYDKMRDQRDRAIERIRELEGEANAQDG